MQDERKLATIPKAVNFEHSLKNLIKVQQFKTRQAKLEVRDIYIL